MITRLLTLAGLAAALTVTALPVTQSVAAPKKPYAQCMTYDGYGRFRPCSALYKREHPAWRGGNECMTDDGYGRYRPCECDECGLSACVGDGCVGDGAEGGRGSPTARRIAAISSCWVTMISWASRLICGLRL